MAGTQSSPRFTSTANPFSGYGTSTKVDPTIAAALAKRTAATAKQETKQDGWSWTKNYVPSDYQVALAKAKAGVWYNPTVIPNKPPASNSSVLDAYKYNKKPTTTKGGGAKPKPTASTNNGGGAKIPVPSNPFEYKWNLPPHKWSLPLDPALVNNASTTPGSVELGKRGQVNDAYRRGRIWWRATESFLLTTTDDPTGKAVTNDTTSKLYGFQFLWNPESFGTSINVRMDVTPHEADRFGAAVGMFPGSQNLSIKVRLDRTNDFACAARSFGRPSMYGSSAADFKRADQASVTRFYATEAASELVKMYKQASSFHETANNDEVVKKIIDLMDRGTLADLEYLYRAINGAGPSGDTRWRNTRNRETADIGFLMPTIVNIDIGPVSYLGYVTNMKVDHLAFTQDMVPIRTDVTLSFDLLATAGVGVKQA